MLALLAGQSPPPAAPVAGYAGLWAVCDEGHITTIAVEPPQRRRGVGELLLNGLIDLGFEMGVEVLTLEVRVSNIAAQRLYAKYGFEEAGRRIRYYTDNGEDALIMTTGALHESSYQAALHTLRWQLFNRLRGHACNTQAATRKPQHSARKMA